MAFGDEYVAPKFEGGAEFVGKEEKAELIASGERFTVTGVRFKPKTQHGDKYFVDIELDGEPRTLTFGAGGEHAVTTRDDLCEALIKYFKSDDATPETGWLEKAGQAQLLRIEGVKEAE